MMDRLLFLVQGSASDPYEVEFNRENGTVSVSCTCAAGENGQACKHRLNVIAGSITDMLEPNLADLEKACDWLAGGPIEAALANLHAAEMASETAKKQLARARKALALALQGK